MYKIIALTKELGFGHKYIYTYHFKIKKEAETFYQEKALMVSKNELLGVMLFYETNNEIKLLKDC